jgi:hypothetical protein
LVVENKKYMTKHTPAPWSFYPKYEGEHSVAIVKDMLAVAEIIGSEGSEGQISKQTALANAKLIAAAPELLEALTEFLNDHTKGYRNPPLTKVHQKAKAAIKKATE